ELHPPAPAQDHVHLLLRLVRVAVRKAIAGRDALVAQARFLELERLGRQAELQVWRAVEPRAHVLQIRLDVPERERHVTIVRLGAQGSGVIPDRWPRPRHRYACSTITHPTTTSTRSAAMAAKYKAKARASVPSLCLRGFAWN